MSGAARTPEVLDYQEAVKACILLASIIRHHDLPKYLRDIEHADAFGPLVDPTLWRNKRDDMLHDREALMAALPLWRFAKKMEAEIEKRIAAAAEASA